MIHTSNQPSAPCGERPEGPPATGGVSAPSGGGPAAAPPDRRIAFLDAARALAMIGVVVMNASTIVFAAERLGEREEGPVTSAADLVLALLMSGKARAMLMVLLGTGAVLAWRAAERRGGRPMVLMLRRYTVLGVLFGVPHLLVFPEDILTHYAIATLVLAPLLPLVAGSGTRALAAAAVLFAAAAPLEYLLGAGAGLDVLFSQVPQTLGFFCVGVWLAGRPELDPGAGDETSRLPVRMVGLGLLGQILAPLVMLGSDLLFPVALDADGAPVDLNADGMPVVPAGGQMLTSLSGTLSGLGAALFFLGLVWWLVRRGRTAAHALAALAPLGRMTLTVYLGSTAVFLLTMKPFEGQVPLMVQYGIAIAYFAVLAVAARWWLGMFRLGPLEWVWRSLTYLRPVPMRRRGREAGSVREPAYGLPHTVPPAGGVQDGSSTPGYRRQC